MQIDGRKKMTKLTVAFRNSSDASKKIQTSKKKIQGRRQKQREKKNLQLCKAINVNDASVREV